MSSWGASMPRDLARKAAYAQERLARDGDKIRAKQAEWRKQNRDYLKEKNTRRRMEKRAMCLVAAARIRARKKGIVFSLGPGEVRVLQAMVDTGVCGISGVSLTLEGPRCATSPSLDRIEPHLGYVAGNVRIVCHALNAGMGDWGEGELRRIVEVWLAQGRAETPSSRNSRQSS
jgi:hypothetical protein